MNEILCSTGALIGRPNGRNYRLLKELTKQLCCDGFEFMMYNTWYEEQEALVDFLCSLHLSIPVVHCEKRLDMVSIYVNLARSWALFNFFCSFV